MKNENWRYASISANAIRTPVEMKSSKEDVLKQYVDVFGYKDFMAHQAQGLPNFPMHNAYKHEESKFKETVQEIYS